MVNASFGAAARKPVNSAAVVREGMPSGAAGSEEMPNSAARLEEFRGDPNFMTSLARGLVVM